jgi:phosphopantothenoylcysteine decarboxylase/phosphopantothenate--cysteine ligase
LISRPTSLAPPPGVEVVKVERAADVYEAVMSQYKNADIIVKSAAVSDYRPEKFLQQKMKKGKAKLDLKMVTNLDILKELGKRKKKQNKPFLVGFAAESKSHLSEGKRKLKDKNLDLIIINDIVGQQTGFGVDRNQLIIVDKANKTEKLPLLSKEQCSDRIWDRVISLMR